MIFNYFKIALRNILRNKVFSFINIVGLSIGIAVSFCIFVFIIYELSYDRHHKNFEQIYRVDSQWKDVDFRVPMTSVPLAESIKREIPGIKEFVRFYHKSSLEFIHENSSFKIDHNYFVDPSIFDVFSYSFLEGDAKAFSSRTNSIILSNSTALKIFGRTDVLGEVITFKYKSSNVDVEIVGIIKDENLPSSITPEILVPFGLLQKLDSSFSNDDWVQLQRVVTFLLLEDAIDVKELAKKIKKLNAQKSANNPNYIMDVNFYVVPLKETYFVNDRDFVPSYIPVVNKDKIIIYSVISISILLMACINFVLLTSAKVSIRYLEIGVRKVLGAQKRDIVQQIILESVLTLMLTLPLTVVFIELIFPYFQDVINIQINSSFYTSFIYVIGLVTINIFIGIVAGSYISFLLFRMKPIDILTRKLSPNFSNLNFRRILLLFQIVVFIALLISTIILKYQMQYIYNKDLGFDNRNVVVIKCREIEGREDVFKNLVVQHPRILDYTFTAHIFPVNRGNKFTISAEKNLNDQFLMIFSRVGNDYPSFSKMELITGKFPTTNKKKKVIINETAARLLDYENPIGKNILLFGRSKREIIGVVKDFHINTLRDKILPVAMHIYETKERLVLRIANDKVYETLDFIRTQWNELSDTPLDYEFTEDRVVEYLYKNEIRFEKLIDFFTSIAILISTMGLFGLMMFSAQQRTKEIGVRKVLGASIFDVLKLLSKEFITLVLLGSVIAFPIAYYFMQEWLDNFAYKISITPDIFIIALVIALLITLVTITLQGFKTAFSNPIDSLRDE